MSLVIYSSQETVAAAVTAHGINCVNVYFRNFRGNVVKKMRRREEKKLKECTKDVD